MRTWYLYLDTKHGDTWWSDWPPMYQPKKYKLLAWQESAEKPTSKAMSQAG